MFHRVKRLNYRVLAAGVGVGLAVCVPAVEPALASAYGIESNSSHKCLDVRFNMQYAGNTVWEWDCNGTAAQVWSFAYTPGPPGWGNGYQIRDSTGRFCLDAPERYGGRWGASVQIWTCDPRSPSEVWYIPVRYTDGTMPFLNRFNHLALDVYGYGTSNGGLVDTWGWNRGYNQDWWIAGPVI